MTMTDWLAIDSGISIGPFKRLSLLGGGRLLTQIAEQATQRDWPIDITTSPRQADSLQGLPATVSEAAPDLDCLDTDTFFLSIGAAWIFKDPHPPIYNLHGTRLPQNRGGGGFSWQILTGNRFGFCQLHRIDPGIDTGPIIATEEFLYPPHCRKPKDYQDVYVEKTAAFAIDFLESVRDGRRNFTETSQPEYLSSYWPRLHTPSQAWIDWTWQATDIERFICAFDEPYEGAKTTWRGENVYLKSAFCHKEDGVAHPFQSGIVYRNNGRWLCVAARGGSLVIENARDGDGNCLLSKIAVGDALFTPPERLGAHATRPSYSPAG